jgi:hypothetical protein
MRATGKVFVVLRYLLLVLAILTLWGCATSYQEPAPDVPSASIHVHGYATPIPHVADTVTVNLVDPDTCKVEAHFAGVDIRGDRTIRVAADHPLAVALSATGTKIVRPLAQFFICTDAVLFSPVADSSYVLVLTPEFLKSGDCQAKFINATGTNNIPRGDQVKHVCTAQKSPGPAEP